MIRDDYSVTSNTVKLLKHLDKLKDLQEGVVSPIMVHCIPTHRCQLNCTHCCFKNRKVKTADLPLNAFKEGIEQFHLVGTNALEFTGGGDPTLYPWINEAIEFASQYMYMGMITNGVDLQKVEDWGQFDWVRVSLNTLETKDDIDLSLILDKTEVSFCYIYHNDSMQYLKKVVDFANKHEIVCRMAPDCIQKSDHILKTMYMAKVQLAEFKDNKYVFLSDFNVETKRRNNDCRIHLIKPCFYADGYVYVCPSAELAIENNRQVNEKARVCHYMDIEKFYTRLDPKKPYQLDCSYCKYATQQEFLEDLLTETKFNEFA